MAKILIEPAKTKSVLGQQDSLENTLKKLAQDVDSVQSGLRYKIAGQQNISQRLRDAAEQITRESQSTRALRSGLEELIALYEQTESGNRDQVAAEKVSIQNIAGSGGTESTGNGGQIGEDLESPVLDWGELLHDVLLELIGPFGSITAGAEKLWEGDIAGMISELVGLVGDCAETMIDKPSAEWFEELFGWGKDGLKKAADDSNFWEELADFSSPGAAVGTVASWATSFLDSFVKNKEEGLTGGRFWGETFTEMGIDLVEGALIGTAVGTVMGASAPVLAVAAATVVVTGVVDWGLDKFVYWVTDGAQSDWVEGVSDLVCDTVEKIVDAVGPVVTNVVDKGVEAVKDLGQAAADTFDKGVNWVKSWFSNGRSRAASGGGIW